MIKKLLVICTLVFSSVAFAQNTTLQKKSVKNTLTNIKNIVASPNPFSVTTKIKFKAEDAIKIEFYVKDIIGNIVHTQKLTCKKGINAIPFYRDKLNSGIYIYSLKANNAIVSKRIVIK